MSVYQSRRSIRREVRQASAGLNLEARGRGAVVSPANDGLACLPGDAQTSLS